MITPSFGLTATERTLPKLALDFTTASLDSRITFTRALNTATRVNNSGYIESVNADLPRFDYDPITFACKGLLVEETRTNLALYSQDFSQAAWTTAASSISSDVINSPNNTQDADKIIENTATSAHYVDQIISVATATSYTMSCFAKAGERTKLQFRAAAAGVLPATQAMIFDLSAGTVSTWVGTSTATITPFPDGWYRCTVSLPATTGAGNLFMQLRLFTTTDSYTGNGTSGLYVWGAQLEAGAFPTSYIPTTTTSLTRNADVATMTGTNFSSWFNPVEGSTVTEALGFALSGNIFAFDDNTDNNRMAIARAATSQYQDITVVSGATQTGGAFGSYTVNTVGKTASAYKLNNFAYVANGGTVGTDTSATVPTVTQLNIGCRKSSFGFLNGYVRKILYYPQRLTNAELQAFSK